jgi:alanine dehydrogenase
MLVLSRQDVEGVLDIDRLIDGLADAFVELSSGRTSVPPRTAAFTPTGEFLGAMPGYVDGILEAKLVTVFPSNDDRDIPSHQALIAVFDPQTGTPLALMDGTSITGARTAAAAALSTRALAREDARVLAVVGAGVQGRAHLDAIPRVRGFTEVRVANRTHADAEQLAAELGLHAVESFEEALAGADVACLCTHSSTPVIKREWLTDGAHVTSVGYATEGGELDEATIKAGLLVVESRVALQPPPAGSAELSGLSENEVVELGEILGGKHPGRTSDAEITVYKSMGHAIEDAAAARLVYEAAVEKGIGTSVDI